MKQNPKKNSGCLSGFVGICLLLVGILSVTDFDFDDLPQISDLPEIGGSSYSETQEPTVDYLVGVPDELKDNVFLDYRGKGYCESLTGDVHITVLFVDDPGAAWSSDEIATGQAEIDAIVKRIADDAAAYGAKLDLTVSYLTAIATMELVRSDYTPWLNSALESVDLPHRDQMNLHLEQIHNADSAPVIFFTKRSGRSFATPKTTVNLGFECAVIYESTTPIYHELCHVFGAKDFYYPPEVETLAESHLAQSIMLDSSSGVMDDLTAYLIGWKDTLSDDAMAFLISTDHLTPEIMAEQHKLENYTGYVENFRIGDTVYTGYLNSGWLDGEGKMERDGAVWEGTWDNGQLDGYGTFTGNTGNSYKGQYVNGVMHGKGKFTWADGSSYEGDYVNGQRHGTGTYRWANGSSYSGQWDQGERVGYGTMVYPDGDVYEGNFVNGQRHGTGTYTWINGDRYTGDWVEDQRTGYGTYYWAAGSRHEGQWLNGMRHGYGVYTGTNGHTRSGTWQNDEYIG